MMRWWVAVLLLLGWFTPTSAGADDIGAAARGVVRVVTIAGVDGRVVGFGHGSGFAVAPNRIVTNAHVVELAQRYPENVVIGIVPSEGSRSFQARVVAVDEHRDLALLEFAGAALPMETMNTQAPGGGDRLVSLGYPGNVDVATAQSAADYIRPTTPVRTEGGFSGTRTLNGIGVLLHTASIARGNSGGPLLDACGRVVGVNSAITQGEEGDANFGFAIAEGELAAFLADAGQPVRTSAAPCTSIEERLRADSEADARGTAAADQARREGDMRAAVANEEALARDRETATRRREDVMAVAVLLLVAGSLGASGAGLLLIVGRRRGAAVAAATGALFAVAAVLVFINRPLDERRSAPAPAAAAAGPDADAALGPLLCRFVPEASRVTVTTPADLRLDWARGGCADGKRQFLAGAHGWTRVELGERDQAVEVQRFDPLTRRLAVMRYLLSADEMRAARGARVDAGESCGGGDAAVAALAQRQSAMRAALPALPNEELVYRCGGG
jgi:V8-like Glu-specific endopeptidase